MPNLRPRVRPSDRLIKTSSSISVSQSWGGERQDKTLSVVGPVQFLSFTSVHWHTVHLRQLSWRRRTPAYVRISNFRLSSCHVVLRTTLAGQQ